MSLGDDLNYLEFLPNKLGREYFISGEVTTLAHFNESLGIWFSEEVLDPDALRVSRSLFVQRDRVQLMVKDMVDALRQGPQSTGGSMSSSDETPRSACSGPRSTRSWPESTPRSFRPPPRTTDWTSPTP